MLGRESRVLQRLGESFPHHLGRGAESHLLEPRRDLLGLSGARLARLLRAYGLKHARHRLPLRDGHPPQDVSVEVHGASLVARAEHARALVARDQADDGQPARPHPGKNPRQESADSV